MIDPKEEAFEIAVADILGLAAISGDEMTVYDVARLMYFRGRDDQAAE